MVGVGRGGGERSVLQTFGKGVKHVGKADRRCELFGKRSTGHGHPLA